MSILLDYGVDRPPSRIRPLLAPPSAPFLALQHASSVAVAVAAGVVISLDKIIDEVISKRILAWLTIRRNFSTSNHH
jgi:hypothetical protein